MQVVAIDLQPVQPYYTQYVSLGVGKSHYWYLHYFVKLTAGKGNALMPS